MNVYVFFCKKKKVKNSFTLSYYFGVFIQLASKMPVVSLDRKEQNCLGQNILWAVFFDKTGEECVATICLLQIALPKGLFVRKVIKCGEADA